MYSVIIFKLKFLQNSPLCLSIFSLCLSSTLLQFSVGRLVTGWYQNIKNVSVTNYRNLKCHFIQFRYLGPRVCVLLAAETFNI